MTFKVLIERVQQSVDTNSKLCWLRCASEDSFLQSIKSVVGDYTLTEDEIKDYEQRLNGINLDNAKSPECISEEKSPKLHEALREVFACLELTYPYELRQHEAVHNNAGSCIVEANRSKKAIILLLGQVLSTLDDWSIKALLGHECGHLIFHSGKDIFCLRKALDRLLKKSKDRISTEILKQLKDAYYSWRQAQEVTADRCSLFVCQDIVPVIRCHMVMLSNPKAYVLDSDVLSYLQQCQEQRASLSQQGATAGISSELMIRSYLVDHFWKSKHFHRKTGFGYISSIIDVENEVQQLLMPAVKEECKDAVVTLCSLTVCVQIAYADGMMSNEEEKCIESLFKENVTNYRQYLPLKVARNYFVGVCNQVRGRRKETFRKIYLNAIKLAKCDGSFHANEQATLIQLGAELGCADYWYSLLEEDDLVKNYVLLDANYLKIDLEKDIVVSTLLSLYNCGGDDITISSLLHHLGARRDNWETYIPKLCKYLERARLYTIPSLDKLNKLEWNTKVKLVSKAEADSGNMFLCNRGTYLDKLSGLLKKLKSELIENLRSSTAVCVRGEAPGIMLDFSRFEGWQPGITASILNSWPSGQSFMLGQYLQADPLQKADQVNKMRTELTLLARAYASDLQEGGYSYLYFGRLFLVGQIDTLNLCAPLVITPVRLEHQLQPVSEWSISLRGHSRLNYAYLSLIATLRGLDMTDSWESQLQKAFNEGTEALLEKLSELKLIEIPKNDGIDVIKNDAEYRWKTLIELQKDYVSSSLTLQPALALGFFPQRSFFLLREYAEAIKDLSKKSCDPKSVLHAGGFLLPLLRQECLKMVPDCHQYTQSSPETIGPPTFSSLLTASSLDVEQQRIVQAAEVSPQLLVSAAIGTDSSQLIAALTLAALQRRSRVVIISEKKSSLVRVAELLTSQGFEEHYCLIYSARLDQEDFYKKLGNKLLSSPVEHSDSFNEKWDSINQELHSVAKEWQELYHKLASLQHVAGLQLGESEERLSCGQLMQYATGLRERLLGLGIKAEELKLAGIEQLSSISLKELTHFEQKILALFSNKDKLRHYSFLLGDCKRADNFASLLADMEKFLSELLLDNSPEEMEQAPALNSELFLGLGKEWFNFFHKAQELQTKLASSRSSLLFAPWGEFDESLRTYAMLHQNYFSWLSPKWWRLKHHIKEWLTRHYPEKALNTINGAQLREYLLLSHEAVELSRIRQQLTANAQDFLPSLASQPQLVSTEQWCLMSLRAWSQAKLKSIEHNHCEPLKVASTMSLSDLQTLSCQLECLGKRVAELERRRLALDVGQWGIMSEPASPIGDVLSARQQLHKLCCEDQEKLSLRSLVSRYASCGLFDVMPVWLMSATACLQVFPRGLGPETVIMADAGLSTVAQGFPLLWRGKSLIMVGDEQQMPIVDYNSRLNKSFINDDSLSLPDSPEDILSAESLFALGRERVSSLSLHRHYRVQDESLLAFANSAFYGGQEVTAAAVSSDHPACRWYTVENATYEGYRNEEEAKKVAELVRQFTNESTQDSIGVLTFSAQQRDAVCDALDRITADAPGGECHCRVKSWEELTGEECDHLILTLGLAPVKSNTGTVTDWSVPAGWNFLGDNSEVRRLAAAISQAQKSCTVVASFQPEHITVNMKAYTGAIFFKLFLEYIWYLANARSNEVKQCLELAEKLSNNALPKHMPADSETMALPNSKSLAWQVAQQAKLLGYREEFSVGQSLWRLPLALYYPDVAPLAVLTDLPEPHVTAQELYVSRPRWLRTKGWEVLILPVTLWYYQSQQVVDYLAARLSPRKTNVLNNT